MADREYTNDELRMEELRQQFLALSGDQDCAGRITFRGPNGEYVGEVKVSARDIEAVTDSLLSLNAFRADMEEATRPAAPLPEVDAEDVTEMVKALENIANGGQL
jgi:hypothetical protein